MKKSHVVNGLRGIETLGFMPFFLNWPWLRWFAALFLSMAFAQAQAAPAKILVLTTHEGVPGDPSQGPLKADGQIANDNLAIAFGWVNPATTPAPASLISPAPLVDYRYGILSVRESTATSGALVRVIDQSGPQVTASVPGAASDPARLLQRESFRAADGGRYDLVVVGTTYYTALQANYDLLTSIMQDAELKPNAMLFFVDSCCDNGQGNAPASPPHQNMARFKDTVLQPAVASVAPGLALTGLYGIVINPLNTTSPYQASFSSLLPDFAGGAFLGIDNVPPDNRLFTVNGNPNSAYGTFFPGSQVYSGNGTCLFGVVDISPFDNVNTASMQYNTGQAPYAGNGHNVGQAFVNAALAGGSCGGNASIAASPATQNVTLAIPAATITLTVKNEQLSALPPVTGGRVEATLPTHLAFAGSVGGTCMGMPYGGAASQNNATGAFGVTGMTLSFGQTCTIVLPVTWTDTTDIASNACIKTASQSTQLRIEPGTSKQFSTNQGQTNDVAAATVVCSAPELALSATALPPVVNAGDTVSYDLTLANLSETAAALDVALADFLPAGATLVEVSTGGSAVACTPGNCNLGSLAALASATYTVKFTASASQAALTAAPAVSTSGTEVTLTNNKAQVTTAVQTTVSVTGSIVGASAQQLQGMAGATIAYALTCTPAAAVPMGGLTVGATGTLSASPASHTVAAGNSCNLAVDPAALPAAPAGYQWAAPAISQQGAVFVVTLTLSVIGAPTPAPVPGLHALALAALGLLLVLAAARRMQAAGRKG
ncbi:putative repeat protein (TIGR01451 family) [Comamonas sp. 4034]